MSCQIAPDKLLSRRITSTIGLGMRLLGRRQQAFGVSRVSARILGGSGNGRICAYCGHEERGIDGFILR